MHYLFEPEYDHVPIVEEENFQLQCKLVDKDGIKFDKKMDSGVEYPCNIPVFTESENYVNSEEILWALQRETDPNREVFEKLLEKSVLHKNGKQKFRSLLYSYIDVGF